MTLIFQLVIIATQLMLFQIMIYEHLTFTVLPRLKACVRIVRVA